MHNWRSPNMRVQTVDWKSGRTLSFQCIMHNCRSPNMRVQAVDWKSGRTLSFQCIMHNWRSPNMRVQTGDGKAQDTAPAIGRKPRLSPAVGHPPLNGRLGSCLGHSTPLPSEAGVGGGSRGWGWIPVLGLCSNAKRVPAAHGHGNPRL